MQFGIIAKNYVKSSLTLTQPFHHTMRCVSINFTIAATNTVMAPDTATDTTSHTN